ncbi:hypothetical protein BH10PSE7_BH10PSE7_44090 [soil metagenome]
MKKLALILSLSIASALVATPILTFSSAVAAQIKAKKLKKAKIKPVPHHQAPRTLRGLSKPGTNFRATGPNEPNGAGISDFCAHTLEIYGRMGVGCNKYGHDFMSWD